MKIADIGLEFDLIIVQHQPDYKSKLIILFVRYNWYYHTVPQKNVNNRVMYWPRGRVWGGSSSLNAMVYIR